MASSSRLKPGETGKIKVTVDLRGKSGRIAKTVNVSTNDPKNRHITLQIRMVIKDRLHTERHTAAEIFSEKCRSCHVDQGKGKMGFDLFKADCFMCHNAGQNAPTITQMSRRTEEFLHEAIRKGVRNTSMPAWEQSQGGPLDEVEIASLVSAIKD